MHFTVEVQVINAIVEAVVIENPHMTDSFLMGRDWLFGQDIGIG